CQQGSNYPWTF
nr:immunoglobulin light chain junction region [Macaca mulatta]